LTCIIEIAAIQPIIHAYKGRLIALSNVLAGQIDGFWDTVDFYRVSKPDKKQKHIKSTQAPGTINGLFILANAEEKIDFIQLQELGTIKATVESFSTTEKRTF
jgi:hypothetical protein